MASEEPLFDPSLKKRKKKQVAFTEDPLGADADPTAPAPDTIDSTTLNGDAVDLGPATAHERMKANGDEGAEKKKEDDDFKAMFGDMKKKKKKKEIPMDFVGYRFVISASIKYTQFRCAGRRFRNIHANCRAC
jgi:translation initiation factor 2 subunit 2